MENLSIYKKTIFLLITSIIITFFSFFTLTIRIKDFKEITFDTIFFKEDIVKIQEEEVIREDLLIYRELLSAYNPNLNHLQIIVDEAKKRGIEPTLAIALVVRESSFRENAVNRNRNGTYDYGYFQLNSRWHNQYKEDVFSHIRTGLDYLKWCLETENGNVVRALSRYNTGKPNLYIGERYAERILKTQLSIKSLN